MFSQLDIPGRFRFQYPWFLASWLDVPLPLTVTGVIFEALVETVPARAEDAPRAAVTASDTAVVFMIAQEMRVDRWMDEQMTINRGVNGYQRVSQGQSTKSVMLTTRESGRAKTEANGSFSLPDEEMMMMEMKIDE